MKGKLIVANWKMNKTGKDAYVFFRKLRQRIDEMKGEIEASGKKIIVCPAFTALYAAARVVENMPEKENMSIKLGAQDVYFEKDGAFTGEISAGMLKEFGVEFVIVGHSERRHILGESHEMINRKLLAALKNKLVPVFCVGEKLEEREKGIAKNVIGSQLKEGLKNVSMREMPKVIIAYEPVWAIGTGKNAPAGEAEEIHRYIRNFIGNLYSKQVARMVYILYGGSITKENVVELAKEKDVDGLLVGGASLDAENFAEIIRLS